jgi:hypothetical protein
MILAGMLALLLCFPYAQAEGDDNGIFALRAGRQLSILAMAVDSSYDHISLRLIPAPFAGRAGRDAVPPPGEAEKSPWSSSARTQYSLLPAPPEKVLNWETGSGKSYLIPAFEVLGFNLVMNLVSRITPTDFNNTNLSTFWHNAVHGAWELDQDGFRVNQFGHPYHGSLYYGFARSAGLDFWWSSGYTFAGSFLWETAAENKPPSINDQIASGIAGSFWGEPFFRMASLLLGDSANPGFWRELGAALISPPTGFNRLFFGERFKPVFPSRHPAVFQSVGVGPTLDLGESGPSSSNNVRKSAATAEYSISYGLPGKPDYGYTRPFDYFQFELAPYYNQINLFGFILTRGLLIGKEYEAGDAYRGVWGLYGTYDYLSPYYFNVASTAFSLGTTGQWWLSRAVALQGSALGGMGYGTVSNIWGNANQGNHYSLTGQGLLALRLIFGDRALLEMAGRGYYFTGLASNDPHQQETVGRLNLGLTFRIYGHHALGIQYVLSGLDEHGPGGDGHWTVSGLSFLYTLISDTRFGAVEWRTADHR